MSMFWSCLDAAQAGWASLLKLSVLSQINDDYYVLASATQPAYRFPLTLLGKQSSTEWPATMRVGVVGRAIVFVAETWFRFCLVINVVSCLLWCVLCHAVSICSVESLSC